MPFGYPLLVWPLALILTGVAGATSENNPGGDRSWASRRSTASAPASRPEPPPGPAHLKGTVTASQKRPMKPAVDLRMAELLEPYEEPPGEFAWSMDRLHAMSSYDVYDLRFPSPVVTVVPENNTVYCEYYRCRGEQARPAVIVLHISDGKFRESRAVCHFLANRGIDGVMLKMPYYGPRRPKGPQAMQSLTQSLDTMSEGIHQAVMDVRRAARLLGTLEHVDPGRIGVLGTSLGGFVGSVASGVDGRFWRSVFILSGGDLAKVLSSEAREVRSVHAAVRASGLSQEQLAGRLLAIEPCTYAGRIDPASVLMVNTRGDPVVPPACAKALANAIGKVKMRWYDGDHYALIWRLLEVLMYTADHLETPASQASS